MALASRCMAFWRGITAVIRCGEACHGAGKPVDRGGKVRGGTPVDAIAGAGFAGCLFECSLDGFLDRVVEFDIFRTGPEVLVQRQKTRMLARAVVVQLARRFVVHDQTVTLGLVIGFVRTAAQVAFGQATVGKPAGDGFGVEGCAFVAGARQRKLAWCQTGGIGSTAFKQRQGLQHLARRAGKDDCSGIAPTFDDLPCFVTDYGMTRMGAFQYSSTPCLSHRHSTVIDPVHRLFPSRLRDFLPRGLL